MRDAITFRLEQAGDEQAIASLTARAFAPMPFSDGDEPQVIERLRAQGGLTYSLVALKDGVIIGHIALSPGIVDSTSQRWFALGPISVELDRQRQGIGSALIHRAIKFMRDEGAAGCVLVGNPDYYQRFGFAVRADLAPAGQPAQYYQMLTLTEDEPSMVVDFHPAFTG